jgi:hypothetical protein
MVGTEQKTKFVLSVCHHLVVLLEHHLLLICQADAMTGTAMAGTTPKAPGSVIPARSA